MRVHRLAPCVSRAACTCEARFGTSTAGRISKRLFETTRWSSSRIRAASGGRCVRVPGEPCGSSFPGVFRCGRASLACPPGYTRMPTVLSMSSCQGIPGAVQELERPGVGQLPPDPLALSRPIAQTPREQQALLAERRDRSEGRAGTAVLATDTVGQNEKGNRSGASAAEVPDSRLRATAWCPDGRDLRLSGIDHDLWSRTDRHPVATVHAIVHAIDVGPNLKAHGILAWSHVCRLRGRLLKKNIPNCCELPPEQRMEGMGHSEGSALTVAFECSRRYRPRTGLLPAFGGRRPVNGPDKAEDPGW